MILKKGLKRKTRRAIMNTVQKISTEAKYLIE